MADIQAVVHERRQHDENVSEQLRLIRQAVLEVQRMNHNKLQSTISLQELHRTVVQEGRVGAASPASSPNAMISELQGLSPRLQELFLRPEYKSLLLDRHLLSYTVSGDSPSGAFGVVHKGTYLGQPVAVKMLLTKDPTLRAVKEILDEALVRTVWERMSSLLALPI